MTLLPERFEMIMQFDENEIEWQKVKCYFIMLIFQNQYPSHVENDTLEISLMEDYQVQSSIFFV